MTEEYSPRIISFYHKSVIVIVQEYVDSPRLITMTRLSRTEPSVTRSAAVDPEVPGEPEEPGESVRPTQVIAPGNFYAILSDFRDFDDGFCISKAIKVNFSEFDGYYCTKSDGQTESSEVLFEVSKEKASFNVNTVLHELITVTVEGTIVKMNLDEYEDIVASANENV